MDSPVWVVVPKLVDSACYGVVVVEVEVCHDFLVVVDEADRAAYIFDVFTDVCEWETPPQVAVIVA